VAFVVAGVSPTAAQPRVAPRRARPDVLTVLCVLVVALAAVVRIAFAARQSYWIDEIFSVNQTRSSFAHVLDVGQTEVHTPLYATLLWGWQHLGGSSTAWTRALSVLFGLAAIVVTEVGLRGVGISLRARRLAVAVTAASGFGIVYAQEDRPYALVLLGATGLTVATLTRLVALRAGTARGWRRWLPWLAWSVLTATAHLLGAVLVGVTAVVLAGTAWRGERLRGAAREIALGALAIVPQAAWLVVGVDRGGFAAGTSWIVAPTPGDAWLLLTTVFGAGGLTPRADGFAWTSPLGVAVILVLLAGSAVLARRGRRARAATHAPTGLDEPDDRTRLDLRLGGVLLVIAGATLLGTYVVSQAVHIWTLRNMIVVVPALPWGLVWVAAALPPSGRGRRGVAVAVLGAMLLSLGAVAHDLGRPYKTDWRALIRYLERVRAEDPEATFSIFGLPPGDAAVAADGDVSDPAGLDARIDRHPGDVDAVATLRRIPGRQIVYFSGGVGRPQLPQVQDWILRRLNDAGCHPVPIYGLIVVSCP
jgi:hypothetical protein